MREEAMNVLCMIQACHKPDTTMRKFTRNLVASAVVVLSVWSLVSVLSYRPSEFDENVEALADGEVNKEKLDEMLAQAIWDTRLVYDPNTETTDAYCLSDGIFVCPI